MALKRIEFCAASMLALCAWACNLGETLLLTVLNAINTWVSSAIPTAPGISWAAVTQLRDVPLIDVGSWTYGRAEFAVVASDGIGLAHL